MIFIKMVGKLFLLKACFCTLFIVLNRELHAQSNVKVVIRLDKEEKLNKKNIWLKTSVCNMSSTSLYLPVNLRFGLNKDTFASFIVEIEKKNEIGEYIAFNLLDEYLPSSDSMILRELKSGDSVSAKINAAFAYGYNFPEGAFRARVLFTISKFDYRLENIYSNWCEFRVDLNK